MSETFNEWILRRSTAHAGLRDFFDEARRDSEFPHVRSWRALESYLRECNAVPEAITMARLAWDRYVQEGGTKSDRS